MPKFRVKAYEVHSVELEVEADSIDEAREIAAELIETGETPDGSLPDAAYDYTMDIDDWSVWQA